VASGIRYLQPRYATELHGRYAERPLGVARVAFPTYAQFKHIYRTNRDHIVSSVQPFTTVCVRASHVFPYSLFPVDNSEFGKGCAVRDSLLQSLSRYIP
jgi:hypothetical protein